jgi:hypothetical protein
VRPNCSTFQFWCAKQRISSTTFVYIRAAKTVSNAELSTIPEVSAVASQPVKQSGHQVTPVQAIKTETMALVLSPVSVLMDTIVCCQRPCSWNRELLLTKALAPPALWPVTQSPLDEIHHCTSSCGNVVILVAYS